MDGFNRDINTMMFRQWVLLYNTHNRFTIVDNKDTITITTEYGYGEVIFNPNNIIELRVTNNITNEIEFYLHFQVNTLEHAIELYQEMFDTLRKLIVKPKIKVLLCCSGGLTTSYFATKINDAIKILDLHYTIDSLGYNQLFDKGSAYDIIMLAPQVSYLYSQLENIFINKALLKIPPTVFAKYDVQGILKIIDNVQFTKSNKTDIQSLSLKIPVTLTSKILSISIFRNSNRVHIAYRLYNNDSNVLLNDEIIKPTITTQDIFDVINTVLSSYPEVECIGISTPGIINNGKVTSLSVWGLEELYLKDFTSKYSQKIVISNDINDASVGYYVSQDKYENISFIFQPTSTLSGVGNIVDGKLVKGYKNLAGETQFLPIYTREEKLQLNKTPEGNIQLLGKTIASICSIFAPEEMVVCSVLLTDLDLLRQEIERYIPRVYIPSLVKVVDIQSYILLGVMIQCNQALQKDKSS